MSIWKNLFGKNHENRLNLDSAGKGAGRKRGLKKRILRLESLEERQLLAVTAGFEDGGASAPLFDTLDTTPTVATAPLPTMISQHDPPTNFTMDGMTYISYNKTWTMSLSWDDVYNNSGYIIEYGVTDDLTGGMTPTISGTSYELTGLASNTKYYVSVRTMGDWSNYGPSVLYEPYLEVTTPKMPLDTPRNFHSTGGSTTSVTLAWDTVDNNNGYLIDYWAMGEMTQTKSCGPDENSATIDGLTHGATYSFRIKAIGAGDYADSDFSRDISAKVYSIFTVGGVTIEATIEPPIETSTAIDRTVSIFGGDWSIVKVADEAIGGSVILSNGTTLRDINYTTIIVEVANTAVNFDHTGAMLTIGINPSQNFTRSVPQNRTKLELGDIILKGDFTSPNAMNFSFYLNGIDYTTDHFTAIWDNQQNVYRIGYKNTETSGLAAGNYTLTVTAQKEDGTEYSSTQLDFTVTPTTSINGMEISGEEETDWTWDDTTKTLTVMSQGVFLTGDAVADMTVIIESDASIDDNTNEYQGIQGVDTNGGTLSVAAGTGFSDGELTTGILYDGTYYYFGQNSTLDMDGTSFTNTSDVIGKIMLDSTTHFITGAWDIDVVDGVILGIGTLEADTSINFAANDQYAYSVVTYQVKESGGSIVCDSEKNLQNTGIARATTEDFYAGVKFYSTSDNAFGVDGSNATEDGHLEFQIYQGDWFTEQNSSDFSEEDTTAVLFGGRLLTSTPFQTKTYDFADARIDSTDAARVAVTMNRHSARVKNVQTAYIVSGYLFTADTKYDIVKGKAIDEATGTIAFETGDWVVSILSEEAEDKTVTATLVKPESFMTTPDVSLAGSNDLDVKYSRPSLAKETVLIVSQTTQEVEGEMIPYAKIDPAIDTYTVGSFFISAANGTYLPVTTVGQTLTVTDGEWSVTGNDGGFSCGSIFLNGAGAQFTDHAGNVFTCEGEMVVVNMNETGTKIDCALATTDDFTVEVATNQTGIPLGGLILTGFTSPSMSNPLFWLNSYSSFNFEKTWNEAQGVFNIGFNNAYISEGTYTLTISAGGAEKFAATQLTFTVTPTTPINGMEISGVEGTDWTWDDTTSTLTVIGEGIVLTGSSSDDMTILIQEGATVNDNVIHYQGVTANGGTLFLAGGSSFDAAYQTAGGLYSNGEYTIAKDSTLEMDGTSFTNTSDVIGKITLDSATHFITGEWNVDVAESDALMVDSVANDVLVNFAANDAFTYSNVTYTVQDTGGGINGGFQNYGIFNATTKDFYSGVTYVSSSENAFAVDGSNATEDGHFEFQIYQGDWVAEQNFSDISEKDTTAVLFGGRLIAYTPTQNKTYDFEDARIDSTKAASVAVTIDHYSALVKNVQTAYIVSGYLFTADTEYDIVKGKAIDEAAGTIAFETGDWVVSILSEEAEDKTVTLTLSGTATFMIVDIEMVSCPAEATSTTLTIAESKTDHHAEVVNAVDHYLAGGVAISAEQGTYTNATFIENTLSLTNGAWTVTETLLGADGGMVVLENTTTSFTDANGVIVTGGTIPMTFRFNGAGVLVFDSQLVVTTALDTMNPYDSLTSLREAIAYADNALWGNTVTFSDTVDWETTPIELTLGELTIDKSLTINGNVSDTRVTIDASKATNRLFNINDGNSFSSSYVNLTGLNLLGGNHEIGGAILNDEELALQDVYVSDCTATDGGAIYNLSNGSLVIKDSAFNSNVGNGNGGAIYNEGYYLSIDKTSFDENSSQNGGAIYNVGQNISINHSSFMANNTSSNGGAISLNAEPDSFVVVKIQNSYFIHNQASGNGGAISVDNPPYNDFDMAVINCVIHSNVALNGGGIYNDGADVKMTVVDSTVSLNTITGGASYGSQIVNTAGELYLINDVIVGAIGSTEKEIFNDVDSKLEFYGTVTGGFATHGVFTEWGLTTGAKAENIFVSTDSDQTNLAIQTGYYAAYSGTLSGNILYVAPNMGNGEFYYLRDTAWYKAGDDTVTIDFDPTNADGNYGLGSNDSLGAVTEAYVTALNVGKSDAPVSRILAMNKHFYNAGAYAIDAVPAELSLVVTTAADIYDPYDNVISLREAIRYANEASTLGNVITFSDDIDWTDPANTITLDAKFGSIYIDKTLTVDAGTLGVTINAAHAGSAFVIESTAGTSEKPVWLKGLTIQGGTGTEFDPMQKGVRFGGAIINDGVTVMMYSTLTGNEATRGGAIANFNNFAMVDSTVVDNTATDGGAFYNEGVNAHLAIGNSTITQNTANSGGGTYNNGGALLLVNSIVVGNNAGDAEVVMNGTSLNYANYSLLSSAYNITTEKSGRAAFGDNTSGFVGSSVDNTFTGLFGDNKFDGQTIAINKESPASNGGTLVGSIDRTIYYYNRDDGYWWDAVHAMRSTYQFDATDKETYGLVNGRIDAEAQNLSTETETRASRIMTTSAFSVGAYALPLTADQVKLFEEMAEGNGIGVTFETTSGDRIEDGIDANDGVITLREAIDLYAGDEQGQFGNIININTTETITLDKNLGSLIVDKNLTIQTTSPDIQLTVNGGDAGSVFLVTSGATDVVLRGLSLGNGGGTKGGVIQNYGGLTIDLCNIIASNTKTTAVQKNVTGGSFYNEGRLSIVDTNINNVGITTEKTQSSIMGGVLYNQGVATFNNVTITGGGSSTNGKQSKVMGAAIYNTGTLSINSVSISELEIVTDETQGNVYGGLIYNLGKLDIASAVIQNNSIVTNGIQAYTRGGMIYNDGTMSLSNAVIAQNELTAKGSKLDNTYGAMVFNSGHFDLVDSTVTDNYVNAFSPITVVLGVGVYNKGTADIINSILTGNEVKKSTSKMTQYSDIYIASPITVTNLAYSTYGIMEGWATTTVEVQSQKMTRHTFKFVSQQIAYDDAGVPVISESGCAAGKGTLVGKITDGDSQDFYYLDRVASEWKSFDSQNTFAFIADAANYGLTGGTVITSALNRDESKNKVSRVVSLDQFDIGAYAIKHTAVTPALPTFPEIDDDLDFVTKETIDTYTTPEKDNDALFTAFDDIFGM